MATTTIEKRPPLKLAWPALIWIGGLHVGALLAFWPGWFSWSGLALCFLLHWLTGGIGICMTYHRLLTHRSFALRPRWLEYFFTIVGTCASEGGPIGWVADHRRHHAHSDDEDDTHTPQRGILLGSHGLVDEVRRRHDAFARVLSEVGARTSTATPSIAGSTRYHIIFPILLLVGLYAAGGMSWLVWGGFVRSVFVLHSTWLVNSATHVWGYRSSFDPRRFDQPLVGGALDLRRGLAQQPPRLPDLGPARPEMVGDRHDLYHHLDDEGVPDRVQHQAGEAPLRRAVPAMATARGGGRVIGGGWCRTSLRGHPGLSSRPPAAKMAGR